MTQVKGTFIAIESPLDDYAVEQCVWLCDHLRAEGFEVEYYSFPQDAEPSSYFSKQYAAGNYQLTPEVTPYAGSLFYALDHFEAASRIRQSLSDGKVVITHKYLGANMVEQGTKLKHPAERRGYFLWLDNLESLVLNAPRPDKTFVLNLPPDRLQKLNENAQSLEQLKLRTALYSELCDLYPKDFVRVDSERNGKILDKSLLQEMLWRLVEPLLPIDESIVTESSINDLRFEKINNGSLPVYSLEANTSILLSGQWIGLPELHHTIDSVVDQPMGHNDHLYLVPDYFDEQLLQLYRQTMEKLLDNYQQLEKGLHSYFKGNGIKNGPVHKLAEQLLPLSSFQRVKIQPTKDQLQNLLINLLSNEQPEAWALGQRVLKATTANAKGVNISAAAVAYHASRQRAVRRHAKALPQAYSTNQSATVTTESFSPRNELDLLPYMLYEQSAVPFNDIVKAIDHWTYSQKNEAFEAYLGKRDSSQQTPGPALDKLTYNFDVLADYQTLMDVQSSLGITMDQQALTPRFGYIMPDIIEEANLSTVFEESFDLSMQLFSDLQQAGYELEAQYATLLGHKQRWQLNINGRQLVTLIDKLPTHWLTQEIKSKLSEIHPILATFVADISPPLQPKNPL